MKKLLLFAVAALLIAGAFSTTHAQPVPGGSVLSIWVLELDVAPCATQATEPELCPPVPQYRRQNFLEGPYDEDTAKWRAEEIGTRGVVRWGGLYYPPHLVQRVLIVTSPAP